jgi:hypothetical protein
MIQIYDTIIINDSGEEIDDECAIKKAFSGKYMNKKIAYVCVGGKMSSEERVKRVQSLIPEIDDIYTIEEFYFMRSSFNMKIIQIGPINSCYMDKVKYIVNTAKPYNYVLQGELGKTVNSKEDSKEAAEYLFKNAENSQIVDGPYPKFTYSNSVYFGKRIQKEIIKLGHKNTLGRAPALPFTVHLVGPGGANYESVKAFYYAITYKDLKTIIPSNNSLNNSLKYFEKVNYEHEFVRSKMDEFNQTEDSQKLGLAQMLTVFEEVFGVNKLILSSDKMFEDQENMRSYHVYNDLMKRKPNTDMTPAYDLKAIHVAMTGIKNASVEDIMLYNDYDTLVKTVVIFIIVLLFSNLLLSMY